MNEVMFLKKVLLSLIIVVLLSVACFASDYNGYIVRVTENTAENLSENISIFSNASLLSELNDSQVVELIVDELSAVNEINSEQMLVKADDEDALQQLIDLGIVAGYEKNTYLELLGYDATLNTNYSDQKWYLDYINADFAWNAGIFGDEVLVAVIDSGVYPHDDIKKNLVTGKNYVDVDTLGETYTVDEYNHGTPVAGIIASQCNNFATVGISFKSKIVPLRVTNGHRLEMANAISAIYDAVSMGCDVINLSFGDTAQNTELYNAVKYAIDRNVIVVAAAGNSGNSGYVYPAAFDEVVSVANAERNASGTSLVIREYSQRNDMVDIAAPGTEIMSLYIDGTVTSINITGTSFSCPMVSAVAALAKSVNPELTQSEFEDLIKSSANSSFLASSGQDSTAWGAGLLDIKAFIQQLLYGDKYYVSENITIDNEVFVYVTNLSGTDTIEKCTVLVSEYDEGGFLSATKNFLFSLDPVSSKEISLTENNFSSSAVVRVITDYIPGDVNGDGEVNIRDASAILRFKSGHTVNVIEAALDVNGDGEVSIRDASAILRYCTGQNVELH